MEGEGGRGRGGRRRRSRGETGGWKYRQRDGGEAEHSTLERRTYSTVCIGSLQAEEATAGTPLLGCGAPSKYCGVPWAQNLAALDSETLSSDPSERPKTKVSGTIFAWCFCSAIFGWHFLPPATSTKNVPSEKRHLPLPHQVGWL